MLFVPPYQQNITLPYINDFLYLPLFLNLNNYGETRIDKVKLIKSVPNESQSTIKVLGVLLDNKLNLQSYNQYPRQSLDLSIASDKPRIC